jgi:rhodanese-related sulfurtransferase
MTEKTGRDRRALCPKIEGIRPAFIQITNKRMRKQSFTRLEQIAKFHLGYGSESGEKGVHHMFETMHEIFSYTGEAQGSGVFSAAKLLEAVRSEAARDGLPFAGSVTPSEAWELFNSGEAVLVDVRTAEERQFVGHVPDTVHVPWMTGISLLRNPRFVKELQAKVGDKQEVVLLLCRSGKRSAAAAEAATKAGFTRVFNVLEGFEGDIDEDGHRGGFNGWRHAGLPWKQG